MHKKESILLESTNSECIAGYYDYSTVHSITDSALVSRVAFNITDEEGEDTPVDLPMTCVLGRYDLNTDYNGLTDEQVENESKKLIMNGPIKAYLQWKFSYLR
ncbi:hypothetical protein TSTA_098580 [Talaromyces stipitatus ATCC 10500]|uniref:Uncharacterized protein n=1 Tax=Talaromyces stipitatus (strain ATCC 10500 / CBS 375.48 / QM 6759 / NRRL 1006) TaxID=441959 RepID=B8MM89_TALSN|nr:uncharacterized protein TSTA_098580 [Talaromyces stipitatus ATCC 10500]EED13601.1 hypothetical protein TSTA_098580 [Talaromyces stipitatus ATCC 10500]